MNGWLVHYSIYSRHKRHNLLEFKEDYATTFEAVNAILLCHTQSILVWEEEYRLTKSHHMSNVSDYMTLTRIQDILLVFSIQQLE